MAASAPATGPHPKGLRKNAGRTHPSLGQGAGDPLAQDTSESNESDPGRPRGEPSAPPPTKDVCRSLRAIPTPEDLGTTQAGRFRNDHSHAGFPQGFMTRRMSLRMQAGRLHPNLSSSRCVWLTNAINRIVKDRVADLLIYV